ncbi:hypothetical protein KAR91_11930 [Candidatus Pacearchaeota archaeon]|nr:hypothetical protein [Candidatus Pacearchaeota archaeon]
MPKVDSNLGAGVGRAAQSLNVEVRKQADEMIKTYDDTRTREAYNDFRELARQKYQELKGLQGRNAIGSGDKYREWYEKESGNVSASLDNITQQDAYGQKAQLRRTRDLDGLAVHASVELQRYRVSVHQGEIAHANADVLIHFGDDKRMAEVERGVVESYERTYAGLDTDAARMKDIAQLRSARIQLVAEDNPERAEQMLKKYKSSLGQAYQPLKGKIKKAGIKKRSQAEADLIMTTEQDPTKQLEKARKISNSEVRDATTKRVKTRQEETKKAIEAQRELNADDLTNEAFDVFRDGGSKEQFLDLIDETDDPKAKKQLVTLSNSLYKKGGTAETDYEKLNEATDEIDVAVAGGKALTNPYLLRKYKAYLTNSTWEKVVKYNKSAIDKRAKQNVSFAKDKVKEIYNRGDFGPTTGKASKNAKRIKADIMLGLNDWVEANPGRDPEEFVDSKIDLIAAEEAAKGLSIWWEAFVPGQQEDERLKALASGEQDDEILNRMLQDRGKDPASFGEKTLDALKETTEFNRYKTQLLSQ